LNPSKKDYNVFGEEWFPGNEAATQKRVHLSLVILQALAEKASEDGDAEVSSLFTAAIVEKSTRLKSLDEELEQMRHLAQAKAKDEAEDEKNTVIIIEGTKGFERQVVP